MRNSKSSMAFLKYKSNPEQAAEEMLSMNLTVDQYENGVQANRKRCLETFKKADIKWLIEMQEELIAYGEEVIKHFRRKRFIKLLMLELSEFDKPSKK